MPHGSYQAFSALINYLLLQAWPSVHTDTLQYQFLSRLWSFLFILGSFLSFFSLEWPFSPRVNSAIFSLEFLKHYLNSVLNNCFVRFNFRLNRNLPLWSSKQYLNYGQSDSEEILLFECWNMFNSQINRARFLNNGRPIWSISHNVRRS